MEVGFGLERIGMHLDLDSRVDFVLAAYL